MLKIIKKYFKLLIGIISIICFVVLFLFIIHSRSLENGNLKDWKQATFEQKSSTIKILTASDENNQILIDCVDKIAMIKGSEKVLIQTATSLCLTGIILKDNI